MQTVRPNTKIMTLDTARERWKSWDVFPGKYSAEAPDQEHVDVLVKALSERGRTYWNEWRAEHPSIQPNLARIEFAVAQTLRGPAGVNLSGYDLSETNLNLCSLAFANLSGANFNGAALRESLINQSTILDADFSNADLTQASMSALKCIDTKFCGADLTRALLLNSTLFNCNFDGADLEHASFDAALLNGSSFRGARLWSAQFGASNLSGCRMTEADLSHAHFVKTTLSGADLTGARVYGANCWDAEVTADTVQHDLKITSHTGATISVDDIRLAQFVYLMTTSENLRAVLDTIGRKAILILGRFGGGGLDVLRTLGSTLRDNGYLPIIFEFARPEDRSYTETVRTLAGLARFVVVDLSGPSVPQELFATVPNLKIPFVPIIEKGRRPYSMFSDLLEYEWVLRPILEFETTGDLLQKAKAGIIEPAETRVALRQARLKELLG